MRYTVIIKFFKDPKLPNLGSTHHGEITENTKSIFEAMKFNSLIDNTVYSAWIHDNIKGKITHWFKNPENIK